MKPSEHVALYKSLACVAVAGAALVGTAAPAAAFTGPNGHNQFVRISAKPGILWSASMDLKDPSGNVVYTWRSGVKSGSGATWWYTAPPEATLDLSISSPLPSALQPRYLFSGAFTATCFKVTAVEVDRSGPDGCTPD